MTRYLRVRNWKEFQHYKDRDPVWFKVYRRLLTDPDFLALTDAQRGQLFCLWLLAAASNNKLSSANEVLARCIGSPTSGRSRFQVEVFLDLGWLEEWRPDEETGDEFASKSLAKRSKSASPEKRREDTAIANSVVPAVVSLEAFSQNKQLSAPVPTNGVPGDIQEVYDHWRRVCSKTDRRYDRMSPARRKIIATRRKRFSVEQLCSALDAVAADDWEDRSRHSDLTVLFRSDETVDAWLDRGAIPVDAKALYLRDHAEKGAIW